MKIQKRWLAFGATLALVLVAAAVFGAAKAVPGPALPKSAPDKSLYQVLDGNSNFKTLVQLINKAKLTDKMKNPGGYTVFAPTDQAFAQLPKGQLDKLQEDPKKLAVFVLNHVYGTKFPLATFKTMKELEMLGGAKLPVKPVDKGKSILVGTAKVISPNIDSMNGLILVVNRVLVPIPK